MDLEQNQESLESKELYQIWQNFLKISVPEEKGLWLDVFIAKFLHRFCHTDKELSCLSLSDGWGNVSNIIAHQLFHDMTQTCQISSPSTEFEDDDGEAFSKLLQQYLLEGRGWKLLWILKILGIENSTCITDLVNNIIVDIPFALTAPVFPSHLPGALKKKLPSFESNCFTREADISCSSKSLCFPTKSTQKRLITKRSKVRLRKRFTKAKEKNCGTSSSENEMPPSITLPIIPVAQQKTILGIHCPNKASLQQVRVSESDELDVSLEDLLSDSIVKDFQQYKLSIVDFMGLVINLLGNMAAIEQNYIIVSSSSLSMLKFSLVTLTHIETRRYKLQAWTGVDVKRVRNSLLKLLFLTVPVFRSLSGDAIETHVNDILQTLLKISAAIAVDDEMPSNVCHENAEFLSDVTIGLLTLINNVVPLFNQDFAKIVVVIRTFSICDGPQIFCRIVSYLEKIGGYEKCIYDILSTIKCIILKLKSLRNYHAFQDLEEVHLLSRKLSYHTHHHDNVLGSVISHSISRTEPMCCVAAICHLLIKMSKTLVLKPTLKAALKTIQEGGICCCIDQSFILNILLADFVSQEIDIQSLILSVLEKVVLPQLGLTNYKESVGCSVCEMRQTEVKTVPMFLPESTVNFNLTFLSENLVRNFQLLKECEPQWKSLNIYNELLTVNDLKTTIFLSKHFSHLFLRGSDSFKYEIFLRAILPNVLKLVFEIQSHSELTQIDQIRMECYLSLLPNLLSCKIASGAFLRFGGIRILYEVLLCAPYRQLALQALEMLILLEIDDETAPSEFASLYAQEPVVTNMSAMVTFSNILNEYSRLFLQKVSRLPYFMTENDVHNWNQPCQPTDSHHFKLTEQTEFRNSLSFICDLWVACKNIILKAPSYYVCVSSTVLSGSFDLFLALLQNLRTFSMAGDDELFEKVLLLVKHLLLMFLHFKTSFPSLSEKIPNKKELLKIVKRTVEDCRPECFTDLKLLLHTLLQCSLVDTEQLDVHPSSLKKGDLAEEIFSDQFDMLSSSENSEDNEDPKHSSYDADSEKSDGDQKKKPTSKNLQLENHKIQHGEVVKMLLDLLICFLKEMQQSQILPIAVHILELLLQYCQDCEANNIVLSQLGFCSELLDGFQKFLVSEESNVKDFQKVVISLFTIVAQHSMSDQDLRKFIRLFCVNVAPFNILLSALNSLTENTVMWPSHALSFPCTQIRLKVGRNENRDKLKSCLQMYDTYSHKKMVCSSYNAWNTTAVIFPLPLDIKWSSFRKHFSSSLWIMLPSQQPEAKESSDTSDDLSEDNTMCHLVSFGSDTVLFEMWIDISRGDLIFRINTYTNGEVCCLAVARCKCILHKGVWQHISLNYKETSERKMRNSKIHLIIDGCKERTIDLKYENAALKDSSSYFMHLGHARVPAENETVTPSFFFGNFMLFRGSVMTSEIAFYLSSLGPDVTSISECPIQQRTVFFPERNISKNFIELSDRTIFNGNNIPSLAPLQKSLLLCYSAGKPGLFTLCLQSVGIIFPLLAPFASAGGFSTLSQHSWPSQKEPIYNKIVIAGHIQSIHRKCLFTAVEHIGGIPVFLFLFAKVIECCSEEETQASALHLLLQLIIQNSNNADYFFKVNGHHILYQLFLSKHCLLSHHMLKVCLDSCLSSSVLKCMPWPSRLGIDQQYDVFIAHPTFFILFLRAFLQSKNTNVNVQVLFIHVVKLLLREDQRYLEFNSQQMKTMQLMDVLLNILKDYYVLADDHLPLEVVKPILEIIKRLICNPIDLKNFWSVCNFLLLLHKASSTYVCHARSSFFFLFASNNSDIQELLNTDSMSTSSSYSSLSSNDSSKDHVGSPHLQTSAKREVFRTAKSLSDLKSSSSDKSSIRRISSLDASLANRTPVPTPGKITAEKDISEWKGSKSVFYKELSLKNSTTNTSDSDNADVLEDVNGFSPDLRESSDEQKTSELKSKTSFRKRASPLGVNSPASENTDRTEIYIGLLNLVQDIINHVDEDMKNVVLDVIQPEVFIVLAYNPDSSVCCAVMGVLLAYLQKASEDKISYFLSIKGFHLLANQLHQLPADSLVVGACINMMFFGKLNAEDQSSLSKSVSNSLLLMSWIPTLAVLPNASQHFSTCDAILGALINLVAEIPCVVELVDNGLCESLGFLVFRLCHSPDRNADGGYTDSNTIFSKVSEILHIIATDLFSSQDSNNFSRFCSLLQIFFKLEMKCTRTCGISSSCVAVLRDCQCILFQSALEFMEAYNFRRLKAGSNCNADQGSLWEILIGMPEGLNPYSTFIMASIESSASESAHKLYFYPDSTVSSSASTSKSSVTRQRMNKELPVSDAVERFQFILSRATDFIVFQDLKCTITKHQKFFLRNLLYSILKGLSTMMEKTGIGAKTKWTDVVWSVKDTLRLELGRLLVACLSPDQDLNQKLFVIEALAEQPKLTEILSSMIFTATKIESLPILLCALRNHQLSFTEKQKKDFALVFSQLKQNLLIDVAIVGDKSFIDTFKKEYHDSLVEDKMKWISKQLRSEKKLGKNLEKLAKKISEIAMDVTKKVVDLQSIERKKFMEEVKMKNSEEVSTRETWHSLIDQFTHERAIWYTEESYPRSWELDPTEGPQRIRRRLRSCQLDLDPRFLLPDFRKNLEPNNHPIPFVGLLEHDNGSSDSTLVINKLHTNEKIEYTSPCKVIMPFEEAKGEILIGGHFLHFIGEEKQRKQKVLSERWLFRYIKEILPRRFELQNNAIEIFLTNGLTYLVAFKTSKDLENIWKRLLDHNLPCVTEVHATPLIQLWRDRSLSNFDYLTQLNKLAGRSFNDLMQYPVFPFILADYTSEVVDLSNPALFRNFDKPIAVQRKAREDYYIQCYNSLKNELICDPWVNAELPVSAPYHYGSHYSNSGTVLHYLVRLLPYTYSLIGYQDNSFDIPDRTFHSINTSWQLVTKDSTSDVKELIPEFFFLPEFLRNSEGFNFGARQNGQSVSDVQLPPWCLGDARLFVLIHRQALESAYVTNNLNRWIDLVFGHKQTGSAAVNAINVFHPATYYGWDFSKLEDPITRQALQATVKTVGQMPRQLFQDPHPMMSLSLAANDADFHQVFTMNVLDTVNGLKWGNYIGSPITENPNLVWRSKQAQRVGKLLAISTNDVFGLPANICLLLNHNNEKVTNVSSATYIRSAALISWFHDDSIVRIKFCRDHPPLPLFHESNVDPVCLCASVPDCNELFVACHSGRIFVYNLHIDSAKLTVSENRLPIQLNGHTGSVTCIHICKLFSIVVTASKDKTCIIWDLNRLCYVRSILGHSGEVYLVCVSDTLGDIASVSHNASGSCLKVHTINGDLVGSVQTTEEITALCYSTAPEGISVNVIATGMADGVINLWSSWDLKPVREIKTEKFIKPITCLTFSFDNQHLYAANVDGTVAVWEKPSKSLLSIPRFLMFT